MTPTAARHTGSPAGQPHRAFTAAGHEHPSQPAPTVLDAFAGPGGWDVGAAIIGMDPASILGVEINANAAAAAIKAGHRRHVGDVTDIHPANFPGITGYICSIIWGQILMFTVVPVEASWPGLA
ncbi:hypothetical protein [Mycolicibacterium fortuitum]